MLTVNTTCAKYLNLDQWKNCVYSSIIFMSTKNKLSVTPCCIYVTHLSNQWTGNVSQVFPGLVYQSSVTMYLLLFTRLWTLKAEISMSLCVVHSRSSFDWRRKTNKLRRPRSVCMARCMHRFTGFHSETNTIFL